jgi:hypothetical protein
MDDLSGRLRDAGQALLGLRGALVAGEPWPLSETWGTEPEADWGPREVLAHVAEMLPYWTDELDRVVAGDGSTPVEFGRVAADPSRLTRIDENRQRPSGALLDDIDLGLDRTERFMAGLSEPERRRVGRHPSRGDLTVEASIERFLVSHLEDHVEQLRGILDRRSAA